MLTPVKLKSKTGKQKIRNKEIFIVMLLKIKLIKQNINICHKILKKSEK